MEIQNRSVLAGQKRLAKQLRQQPKPSRKLTSLPTMHGCATRKPKGITSLVMVALSEPIDRKLQTACCCLAEWDCC